MKRYVKSERCNDSSRLNCKIAEATTNETGLNKYIVIK